jgi:surface antigen
MLRSAARLRPPDRRSLNVYVKDDFIQRWQGENTDPRPAPRIPWRTTRIAIESPPRFDIGIPGSLPFLGFSRWGGVAHAASATGSSQRPDALGGVVLQSGLKLLLICASMAALIATGDPTAPPAAASPPTPALTDSLRAERASLIAQIGALGAPRSDARGQLVAVERELASVQAHLLQARHDLAAADAELQRLARQIFDDEHTVIVARAQLARLVRATYEMTGDDGFAAAVFSAGSFWEAMDRVRGAQQVSDQVRGLQEQLDARDHALVDARAAVQRDGARAQSLEQQLSNESNHLMALVGQRALILQALDGPSRALAERIAQIDQQLASPPSSSDSPCGNRFAYGYCTYYVATRRCIPWLGNAWQWWGNAAAMGYREGHYPAPGAVAVFGRSRSSPEGHVAFVEVVGPNGGVPAGSFLLSEMNYGRWNQVDQRVVSNTDPGLVGFIYGPG